MLTLRLQVVSCANTTFNPNVIIPLSCTTLHPVSRSTTSPRTTRPRTIRPRTFFRLPRTARRTSWTQPLRLYQEERQGELHPSRTPQAGLATPRPSSEAGVEERREQKSATNPFYFEVGYAGWAKRASRPFPPPFFSAPSRSFSDPLSTSYRSMDRRPRVNGQMIRGVTNGDDALLASETMIATNDGVGQWATRERGHAALWSRLMLHFWAVVAEEDGNDEGAGEPDMVQWLEQAYARTREALREPNEWLGTTTTSAAVLHYRRTDEEGSPRPVLYVTQLGDCKILVVREVEEQEHPTLLFATKEQWHFFDCPRQLGTNSPDTPSQNAVLDKVDILEDDIVLAMSDGVTDNLWEEEIVDYAVAALKTWKEKYAAAAASATAEGKLDEAMKYVAQEIVINARKIAEDPFAASPFMEKAVDEGLAIEGGKLDDISVVAAICKRRKA